MKIGIFQFSGTGNTFYVAATLQCELKALGHQVDLLPIEAIENPNQIIESYDRIGIGYPIYGSDAPRIVRSFIDRIEARNMRAFVFCTQWLFSGDGAAHIARKLEKKGFDCPQLAHFRMPNNITDYLSFLPVRTNFGRLKQRKERQIKRFARVIDQDKRIRTGLNPLSHLLGNMQRKPYRANEDAFLDHLIKIDDTCILCGTCIDLCPVNNFEMSEGKLREKNQCIACYRCINHCPVNALHASKKRRVKKPYLGPVPIKKVKKSIIDS
jgi:ferredoxin/flavodoxin